jgi:hypothetical protein
VHVRVQYVTAWPPGRYGCVGGRCSARIHESKFSLSCGGLHVLWQAGEVDVSVFSLSLSPSVKIGGFRVGVCVCVHPRACPPGRKDSPIKEGVAGSVWLTSADCGRSTVVCTAL